MKVPETSQVLRSLSEEPEHEADFCLVSFPQVIRDYDEEEQGYDSEHEEERERSPDMAPSPHAGDAGRRESDQHSDEQQDEDMDMSD